MKHLILTLIFLSVLPGFLLIWIIGGCPKDFWKWVYEMGYVG